MKNQLNAIQPIQSAANIWKGFLIIHSAQSIAIMKIIGYTAIAIAGKGSQNTFEYGLESTFVQENTLFISQKDVICPFDWAVSIL